MNADKGIDREIPKLRGKVHLPLYGFFFLLLFTLFKYKCNLFYKLACYVYLLCTMFMLTIITVFHNKIWDQVNRLLIRRLDYAAIFLMVGGSGFPVAIHYLYNGSMVGMVLTHWTVILLGAFWSLLFNFTSTPRWFRSTIYSLSSSPYFLYPYLAVRDRLYKEAAFMVSTGFFYITGSIFYASGRPNLIPGIFEYHELFHLFCCFGFLSSLAVNYHYWQLNKM